MDRFHKIINRVLLVCFIFPACLSAQKFHFQNYNVQQGLIQSQVNAITQDHYDNLWFCTLGGISRFDGKSFTNYSETDGLISNYANTILAGSDSNIWIGTAYGLSKFNGTNFRNFKFSELMEGNSVKSIQEDGKKRIWVLAGGKVYRMDHGENAVRSPITGDYERVSAIQADKEGVLWACVFSKGIFQMENDEWKLKMTLPETDQKMFYQKIIFDVNNKNKLFLLTGNSIFTSDQVVIRQLIKPGSVGFMVNMCQDNSDNLWVSSSQGLFQYSDSGLIAFNPANGYEGTNTTAIFQDRENNIWIGTNGTGVFRYSIQPFLIFDQFTSARNTAIMPMLSDHGRLFLGTDGSGLYMYDGKNMNFIKGLTDNPNDQHISGIFHGRNNEIYVLASSGLFSKYADGKMTEVPLGDLKGCIHEVIPDKEGGFWVASCMGFVHISSSGKTEHLLDKNVNRILSVPGDSILVATDVGLYVESGEKISRKINDSLLSASRYMALSSIGKYYLLATANKGFIIYNRETGNRRQFTTKDGLNSDFIYSVVTDHKNQIWLGTGRGINRIDFDTAAETTKISSLSIPGDISSSECNEGAAVYDDNSNLWFGTVSCLFKFMPYSEKKQTYLPPVVLQEVQVFGKDINPTRFAGMQNSWYSIPRNLSLSHNENHLTFSFRCPSFLHSESILYQYMLEGMEKSYSALTTDHFVVYPALPPGHYTFRARAFIEGIGYSTNNVDFSFEIKAAFYQKLYFRFLMLLFLMGIILWIQWMRIRTRQKRIHQIEEVKREENIKVRQTASEDFHDEVGNSLTRIQVLTDVLNSKLGGGHDEEKRIIGQIKENVSGLYQGTRDILWALNPESDMIKEIGHRLESSGVDLFQDTGICFSYENLLGESETLKLPGNYNRNIMMIFKEAMSNCLKHAQAHQVKLKIQKTDLQEILIELSDDGIGFNQLFIKKGHGFQNMQKRANRIKAILKAVSNPGDGTRYELSIPVFQV